jgi:hypothetical protein
VLKSRGRLPQGGVLKELWTTASGTGSSKIRGRLPPGPASVR